MNPNQKLFALSGVAIALSVLNLLIGISNVGLNVSLHLKEKGPKQEENLTCTTINQNNTTVVENTYVNNTTIITKETDLKTPSYLLLNKSLCNVEGWVVIAKDNAVRFGESEQIIVTREPYVSCDPTGCKMYALHQGTTIRNKHSNGTIHDRTAFRGLISTPLGTPPTVSNSDFMCVGWSSTTCHDGIGRMTICIQGNNDNATATVYYNRRLTTTIKTWARNILRTQESECVCHNGTCAVVMTDGSASSQAYTKVMYFHKGLVVKEEALKGSARHIEECSCYGHSQKVTCVCRDNWQGANRPIIEIDMNTLEHTSRYVCTGILTDTSRPGDKSSGDCSNPITGSPGAPGVKGFGFLNGDNTWLGRTISPRSRSGFEMLKIPNAGIDPNSRIAERQEIVDNNNWSGYSGSFIDYWNDNSECYNPCFYVELIRGRPEEAKYVWWTSNSLIALCGSPFPVGSGSFPDGAQIQYFS
ncbi:neuraminidase [Influenza A virus (A/mallard/Sweden/3151/2003(H10N7))]|uniref:Neuraminidase n=1 Tax=Influenza A virus (A/mallard/Sweden/3151/2003(H10N7)) TaxID=1476254 RepID=A0A024CQQ5_9INFA|nr:neuraminidase [Influenza A virus (A/mallard/Sweden/3151/2003(H10N7))]